MYKAYRDRGLVVLGLVGDAEADRKSAANMVQKKTVTFPVLLKAGSVRRLYGAELFGGCFLIDKDGVIRNRFVRYWAGREKAWEAEVRRLLSAGG